MQCNVNSAQQWDTSSTDHDADTAPLEQFNLGKHLNTCRELRGRLFTLQCFAEGLHRFLLARFVSTVVLVALSVALGARSL